LEKQRAVATSPGQLAALRRVGDAKLAELEAELTAARGAARGMEAGAYTRPRLSST